MTTVSLRCGPQVPATIRGRILHAFNNFCAVYGYHPVDPGAPARVRLIYGVPPADGGELALSATYAPRAGSRRREPPVEYRRPGLFLDEEASAYPCFHPAPAGRPPDWLGEIFEWLGGEAEHLAEANDPVGRVPVSETLHGIHGLDPRIPYAAVAMHGLNQDIAAAAGDGLVAPEAPRHIEGLAVVPSHDLDFLPISRWSSLRRELKNAAIAALHHRDTRLTLQILGAVLRGLARGRTPLDRLEELEQGEREAGFRSSAYVLCVRRHRRDANYDLADRGVVATLGRLAERGMEIGVHGSYTSLDVPDGLAREYAALRAAGFRPAGGRQHWLRARRDRLFPALAAAGACYDSTDGYSDRIGFRSGACFPFVPWDFSAESAFPLLEIPLAVMDVAIYGEFRDDLASAETAIRGLCRRAARYGWGGFSVLWHNTVFGGAQLPRGLANLYWRMREPGQTWMTGAALTEAIADRFVGAGLRPGER